MTNSMKKPMTKEEIAGRIQGNDVLFVDAVDLLDDGRDYDEFQIGEGLDVKRQRMPRIDVPLICTVNVSPKAEIVLSNYDHEMSEGIVRNFIDFFRSNDVPTGFIDIDDDGEPELFFVEGDVETIKRFFLGVVDYNGDGKRYIQIIMPDVDDEGRQVWPWDEGVSEYYLLGQPLLGSAGEEKDARVEKNMQAYAARVQADMQRQMAEQQMPKVEFKGFES